jgi:hypothetical protein
MFDAPRSASSHALLPKRIVAINYWPEQETSRNNTRHATIKSGVSV